MACRCKERRQAIRQFGRALTERDVATLRERAGMVARTSGEDLARTGGRILEAVRDRMIRRG